MAIGPTAVWEVRGSVLNGSTGPGSDNNGGLFIAGSASDFSQSNTPTVSVADGVTTGTTTVTSVTGGFLTAHIGNGINIVGDGIYQITARASTNSITVDRATGTATGQTLNVGGALATVGKLAANMVAKNKAFLTGAFTQTATATFVGSGGAPTASSPATTLIGYGTARGDTTHATITLSGSTLTGINTTTQGLRVEQIDVDCASQTTSIGISCTASYLLVRECKIANFTSKGINLAASLGLITQAEITGGVTGATDALDMNGADSVLRCYIHDNACHGIIQAATGGTFLNNIIANNTGTSDGIQCVANQMILNNTIHGNGRDGIRITNVNGLTPQQWRNNILSNNGGVGITLSSSTALPAEPENDGNAYFTNTGGPRSPADSTAGIFGVNPYVNTRDVTLSVSPYVGPTSGGTANFALNKTAGGGAACRGAASPGAFPGLATTTGSLDMGAVQSAGGGGAGVVFAG